MPYNTKQIRPKYISKYNYKRDNKVILLIITDDEHSDGVKNWYYLTVKSISKLLRGITSSNHGNVDCLNCFHSYSTEIKLKKHEKVCKDHDFCHVKMTKEDNKILKCNPGEKSLKVLFIIFADLECLLENMSE